MTKIITSRDNVASELNVTSLQHISVVIPCFNEAGTIGSLADTLKNFQSKFANRFKAQFILVDDGSTDQTHKELIDYFGGIDGFMIISHGRNRGIAAAILTGIKASTSEIVVSIDSDCTYDPLTLDRLVDQMQHEVMLVTASPYHPQGRVLGVPRWRLWLSKQASAMYRRATKIQLYTFTSCFRAYRRSAFIDMELQNEGFVGVAEMLWLTLRKGGKVVEIPADLSTRKLGFSKLKTVPVIRKHLSLLRRIRRTPTSAVH